MFGKIYLLDFWATWCAPCVAELPNFQKVYDKFKTKGFEIIGISFDKNKKIVQDFRKKNIPMPWLHTVLNEKDAEKVSYTFEAPLLPKLILVDSKGKIMAVDGELRHGRMEKILERLYNK